MDEDLSLVPIEELLRELSSRFPDGFIGACVEDYDVEKIYELKQAMIAKCLVTKSLSDTIGLLTYAEWKLTYYLYKEELFKFMIHLK